VYNQVQTKRMTNSGINRLYPPSSLRMKMV